MYYVLYKTRPKSTQVNGKSFGLGFEHMGQDPGCIKVYGKTPSDFSREGFHSGFIISFFKERFKKENSEGYVSDHTEQMYTLAP